MIRSLSDSLNKKWPNLSAIALDRNLSDHNNLDGGGGGRTNGVYRRMNMGFFLLACLNCILYLKGVILAADQRLTSGSQIDDVDTIKIRRLTNNFHCCFSGTAADGAFLIEKASAALLKGNTEREPSYEEAVLELLSTIRVFEREFGTNLSTRIILGGYDKSSYHLCEIYTDDDPELIRDRRDVKKVNYAAMGSGGLFASKVLYNYDANTTTLFDGLSILVSAVGEGILNDCHSGGNINTCTLVLGHGANYACHSYIRPMSHIHDNSILTEAYELFTKVYRQILGEKKIEKLCGTSIAWDIGLIMLNDLYVGGFDSRAFIHKFSSIIDESARSGLLHLCSIGLSSKSCCDVDTLRGLLQKSGCLTGFELHQHILEGMEAYYLLQTDRVMNRLIDFQSIFNNFEENRTELFSVTTIQLASYLKYYDTPLDKMAHLIWEDPIEVGGSCET